MRIVPRGQLSLPFGCDDTKVCIDCGLAKTPEDFYVTNKRTGNRFTWCKTCHNARTKRNYETRQAAHPEINREWARRTREKHPEKVKEWAKRYKKENPAKVRETARKWKRANPEKMKAKRVRYRKRHKDVIDASHARFRAKNHDLLKARHKLWRDSHVEQHRGARSVSKNKRRARIAGSGGSHTADEWRELKAFYDHTCLLCQRKEPEIKLTKDHVIPIALLGTDDIGNIQPLCRSCNSIKHTRSFDLRTSV